MPVHSTMAQGVTGRVKVFDGFTADHGGRRTHPGEVVQRFLNWNEQSKGVPVVKAGCGVLVMLDGLWLISSAP